MSHRTNRLIQLGDDSAYVQKYTDHSDEIARMRAMARDMRERDVLYPMVATNHGTLPVYYAVTILETAVTLLETHDETGISLDEWTGPRELVILALDLAGYDGEDVFLPNHI